MVLGELRLGGRNRRRLQRLIRDHASRLLTAESSPVRVKFRDAYFRDYLRESNDQVRDYLRESNDQDAREVAERLVRLVGERPTADGSEELIRYAVRRSAWHVWNDAKTEADRLVRETNWASVRFGLLADPREGDPPPDLLVDEMVGDLVRLEPLVKDTQTGKALRDLRRAIVRLEMGHSAVTRAFRGLVEGPGGGANSRGLVQTSTRIGSPRLGGPHSARPPLRLHDDQPEGTQIERCRMRADGPAQADGPARCPGRCRRRCRSPVDHRLREGKHRGHPHTRERPSHPPRRSLRAPACPPGDRIGAFGPGVDPENRPDRLHPRGPQTRRVG